MIDYYKLFGLEKDCGSREIEERYNEKMLSINSSDILEYTFKAKYYREGLEILTNYAVRSNYDDVLQYQYAVTTKDNNSNLRFSDIDMLNDAIIRKVEESIIDALIANPNLGYSDFYTKYMSNYAKDTLDNIKKTITPYVNASRDDIVRLTENNYNFFHGEIMKPKQKVMAMS